MITAQLNFKGSIVELKEYPETMTVEEAYQDFMKDKNFHHVSILENMIPGDICALAYVDAVAPHKENTRSIWVKKVENES